MIKHGTAALIVTAAFATLASADSVDISFYNITQNGNSDLSAQLNVNVAEVLGEPTYVDFTFTNNVGIQSSVSEIYFADGPPGSLFSGFILSQTGSSFIWGSSSPGDLPGGESIANPFDVTSGFQADAQGNPSVGLDKAEDELVIRAIFLPGVGFGDLVERIDTEIFRIGMHVRSIDPQGGSDSYISGDPGGGGGGDTPIVPLPTTAAMGAVGLAGLASRRRR